MTVLTLILLFIQITSLAMSLFGVQMSKVAMYEADSYEKIVLLLISISFFTTGAIFFTINTFQAIYNLATL